MEDDDESTRNSIAQGGSGNGPEDDLKLLTRKIAVVEKENRELNGDHRQVVEDFGNYFGFRA